MGKVRAAKYRWPDDLSCAGLGLTGLTERAAASDRPWTLCAYGVARRLARPGNAIHVDQVC